MVSGPKPLPPASPHCVHPSPPPASNSLVKSRFNNMNSLFLFLFMSHVPPTTEDEEDEGRVKWVCVCRCSTTHFGFNFRKYCTRVMMTLAHAAPHIRHQLLLLLLLLLPPPLQLAAASC
jgi:hypothetical protein